MSFEDAKKEVDELKASFKASLKNSLSKAGSIVTEKNNAPTNQNFASVSRMADVTQRIDAVEDRITYVESFNEQAFSQLHGMIVGVKDRNKFLESQTPEAKATAQLIKDNQIKKDILSKKKPLLNLLDVGNLSIADANAAQE